MSEAACTHEERITAGPLPFAGPADGARRPNPAAHGGIRYTDLCAYCGATRTTNINGGSQEVGAWRAPKETR